MSIFLLLRLSTEAYLTHWCLHFSNLNWFSSEFLSFLLNYSYCILSFSFHPTIYLPFLWIHYRVYSCHHLFHWFYIFKYILVLLRCIYVYLYNGMYVRECACRIQKRVSEPLDLGLQVVLNHSTWVVRTELGFPSPNMRVQSLTQGTRLGDSAFTCWVVLPGPLLKYSSIPTSHLLTFMTFFLFSTEFN